MRTWMRWGLLLVLGLSGALSAAPIPSDTAALALSARLAKYAEARAANGLETRQQLVARDQMLADVGRLQLEVEAGQRSVSPDIMQRLDRAAQLLEIVKVQASLVPRSVAKANGTVTGTIIDGVSGLPLTIANAVRVTATEFSNQLTPGGTNNVFNDASGTFTLSLPPGRYHIRTTSNNQGYINQAYGFGNCVDSFYCPRYVGTIVTVPDGGSVTGINITMQPGGRISGTLTRSDTGAPLLGSNNIQAIGETGSVFASASTDASGNFTITGLAPGRYRVIGNPNGTVPTFLAKAFGGVSCNPNDCANVVGVTFLTITGTETVSGINIALDEAANSISGAITASESGLPIPGDGSFTRTIALRSADQRTIITTEPDANGQYTFTNLRSGNYYVSAYTPDRTGQVVSGLAPLAQTECLVDTCDFANVAAPISIGTGTTVTGINLQLPLGARISGTVRATAGGAAIANATVTAFGPVVGTAVTDAAGNYTIAGLPQGIYYLSADATVQNYVVTWLGGAVCRGFHCTFGTGAPLTVAANANISGQDFSLDQGGTLSGLITDQVTGAPAPRFTRLELFDTSNRLIVQLFSSGTSGYSVPGLVPGAYKAVFASSSVVGWVDTAFGGLACPRGGCDQSLLPSVFVTAGATTSGINVTLPRGPRIFGRVVDAATSNAIVPQGWGSTYSGNVALNNNLSNYAGFATIDRAGNFVSRTGFSAGAYFFSTFLLRNNTPIGGGYIDEAYDNIACPYGSCGLTSGTPINVASSDVTGINVALAQGGGISGRVTDAATSNGLGGVTVRVFDGAGRTVAVTGTTTQGNYRVTGLPAGNYFATTDNALGYQDELFNGFSCEPFCNPTTGSVINVAGTAITTGRDFALERSVTVSGVVTDGGPAANVPVEIYGQIGNFLRSTVTNASGQFTFQELAPGRFFVRTRNTTGRVDDLFYDALLPDNVSPTKPNCVGFACQVRLGTPITLGAGSSFTTANLSLAAPAVISGTVSNLGTTGPMSGVSMQLLDARGAVVANASTSAAGAFSFPSLAAGSYYLVSRGTPGFVDLAFPNVPCPQSCNGLNGTPIAVIAGATSSGNNLSLSTGGAISGTVRNSLSNLPIAGTAVQVYNASNVPVAQIATNASGNYELNNLADGPFYVRTQNALGFINEVFQNRACGGYCDMLAGDAVTITGGVPVGLVDFSLDAGGSISGRLTNSAGGAGIALAEVQAIDVNGLIASRAQTNATGDYTLGGLQPGIYKLRTTNTAGFINQIYRTTTPLTCSPTPCTLSAGTGVNVAGAVTGIDIGLSRGGTISGTAADLFNNPLPTGTAVLLDSNGIELASVAINAGLFEFNGLAAGSYYVLIKNNSGLVDVLYPSAPCPAGACNITAVGTPIVLPSARSANAIAATASIDLRLPEGREISGRVTRGAQPLSGVTVYVYDSTGRVVASGVTDGLGDYVTAGGLPAGSGLSYFAATTSPSQRGVLSGEVNEVWNNVPCMLNCGVTTTGTAIPLPAGVAPLADINFDLSLGGAISGRVQSSLGADLSLVRVELYDAAGKLVGTADSNSLGNYTINGLAAGTYFARTVNVLGLQDNLFGGAACGAGCNVLTGTPITVSGTNTTANIDFALAQPVQLFRDGFE